MDNRIVNGDLAVEGRYPYMAALLLGGEHFCGGTLIAPSVVLTASHCTDFIDENLLSVFQVALDCVDITPENIGNCEVIDVASVTLHPEYDVNASVFGGNDVAVLLLDAESTVETIQIASPGFEFTDEAVFYTGWGNEFPVNGLTVSGTLLREAPGNLISNEACIDQSENIFGVGIPEQYNYFSQIRNTDTMICTIGNGQSVCQGDSGGPAMIRCNGDEKDLQVGVTSFGVGCANQGVPAVFARTFTDSAFQFINEQAALVGQQLDIVSRNNLNGFCPDDPIVSPAAPTPFPTFDGGAWTCDSGNFATQDGCHCNCGIPDPDCETDNFFFIGCDQNEVCEEGLCVEGTPSPLPFEFDLPPPEWICPLGFFDANDGCDCNCGAPDPDCLLPVDTEPFNCDGQCLDGLICQENNETGSPQCLLNLEPLCTVPDGNCTFFCGDGVNEFVGACSPDPDCFAPNCFDNNICTTLDGFCFEECGDGNSSTFGGCEPDPDCIATGAQCLDVLEEFCAISDGNCTAFCGDGVDEFFGACSPDPDCFAPNCFNNTFCTTPDGFCFEECGDGNSTTFGGCEPDPDCNGIGAQCLDGFEQLCAVTDGNCTLECGDGFNQFVGACSPDPDCATLSPTTPAPTENPTENPTKKPSTNPTTISPTDEQTDSPSSKPTSITISPTAEETVGPSSKPTDFATERPTNQDEVNENIVFLGAAILILCVLIGLTACVLLFCCCCKKTSSSTEAVGPSFEKGKEVNVEELL